MKKLLQLFTFSLLLICGYACNDDNYRDNKIASTEDSDFPEFAASYTKDGEFVILSTDGNTVNLGTDINLKVTAKGAEGGTWLLKNGTTGNSLVVNAEKSVNYAGTVGYYAVLTFADMGVYALDYYTGSSYDDGGQPLASYSNFITVLGSDIPLNISSVARTTTASDAAGIVNITFDRELSTLEAINPAGFTASIVNADQGDIDCSITGASINGNVLALTFDTGIYNSDDVTINYTQSAGNLASKDGYTVEDFSSELSFSHPDLLSAAGFDTGFESSTNDNVLTFLSWAGWISSTDAEWVAGSWFFTDAGDNLIAGSKAYVWNVTSANTLDPNTGFVGNLCPTVNIPVESGKTYRFTYWSFVKSQPATGTPNVMLQINGSNDWTALSEYPADTTPYRSWEERHIDFTHSGSTGSYPVLIRVQNPDVQNGGGDFQAGIDQLSMYEYEARP